MINFKKTIFAQSTPLGNGGIGIIKISGNKSFKIAIKILGKIPKNRYAEYLPFKNIKGNIIDYGIAIFYKKPYSFTGEDILELHSHGGQIIIETILKNIVNLKIKKTRLAKPGEFTKRAFINGKIDLIQAECINNIISAESEKELYSTINLFQGKISKKIKSLIKKTFNIKVFLEKNINFYINNNNINIIKKKILFLYKKIKKTYKIFKKNKFNKEGIAITIVGAPNTGKSSLMNKLTQKKTSIVTNIKGTTRDIIKEYIYINNIPIKIIDTAGIHYTKNKIEKIGIKKTFKKIKSTKFLIFMENAKNFSLKTIITKYKEIININIKKKIIILLRNKIDLTNEKSKIFKKKKIIIINTSIKYNLGIKKLKQIIKEKLIKINNTESKFSINTRHMSQIKNAFKKTKFIKKNFNKLSMDIISTYIENIQKKLENILGIKNTNSYKILNKIFSKFCIGK